MSRTLQRDHRGEVVGAVIFTETEVFTRSQGRRWVRSGPPRGSATWGRPDAVAVVRLLLLPQCRVLGVVAGATNEDRALVGFELVGGPSGETRLANRVLGWLLWMGGGRSVPGTATIDGEGRLRRIDLDLGSSSGEGAVTTAMQLRTEFGDFGCEAEIELPTPTEVGRVRSWLANR